MFFIKGGWCGKLVGALSCESQGGKRGVGGESKIQTKTNSRNKKKHDCVSHEATLF